MLTLASSVTFLCSLENRAAPGADDGYIGIVMDADGAADDGWATMDADVGFATMDADNIAGATTLDVGGIDSSDDDLEL